MLDDGITTVQHTLNRSKKRAPTGSLLLLRYFDGYPKFFRVLLF